MPDPRVLEQRTHRALLAREARYAKEIQKTLKTALDSIRAKMTVIYERYAIDGKLSLANMTQYGRLARLEKDILATVTAATRKNLGTIRRLRPDQYGDAFFRYAWIVDQTTGVSLKWGALNRRAIIESLDNRMYQIAMKDYPANARSRIASALNNGLIVGQSYPQMARDLKAAIDTTFFRAMRIVRTEGQTAANAGQEAAYVSAQAQGVDLTMIWDATLDGRTRDTHGAMDGKERQEDGLFNGPGGERAPYPAWEGLSAGERINCRCRIRANVNDVQPALRRTRDGGVVPYQTYEQWSAGRTTFG